MLYKQLIFFVHLENRSKTVKTDLKKEKAPSHLLFPIPSLIFIRTIRTQFDADDAAKKGEDKPNPAVDAERGDAAEVSADVAAERKTSAVTHHQSADKGADRHARWALPLNRFCVSSRKGRG